MIDFFERFKITIFGDFFRLVTSEMKLRPFANLCLTILKIYVLVVKIPKII